ncbi:MAG TPA: single-stranded DNA-binding protein, partial [Bacteroidaceae bacterium]|nr:single-stranded DNA-binding protein [Bacteroidaceae bacterium]
DLIYIEGKITNRSWDSDNGKKYITEIVADNIELLGNKGERAEKDPFEEPSMSGSVDKGIGQDDILPF